MSYDEKVNQQYKKEHTKRLVVWLNLETDADILAKLDSVDNKQGYIKTLIRNDIAKEKGTAD